jgi:hypothetical protein
MVKESVPNTLQHCVLPECSGKVWLHEGVGKVIPSVLEHHTIKCADYTNVHKKRFVLKVKDFTEDFQTFPKQGSVN